MLAIIIALIALHTDDEKSIAAVTGQSSDPALVADPALVDIFSVLVGDVATLTPLTLCLDLNAGMNCTGMAGPPTTTFTTTVTSTPTTTIPGGDECDVYFEQGPPGSPGTGIRGYSSPRQLNEPVNTCTLNRIQSVKKPSSITYSGPYHDYSDYLRDTQIEKFDPFNLGTEGLLRNTMIVNGEYFAISTPTATNAIPQSRQRRLITDQPPFAGAVRLFRVVDGLVEEMCWGMRVGDNLAVSFSSEQIGG